jgi:YtkA-like
MTPQHSTIVLTLAALALAGCGAPAAQHDEPEARASATTGSLTVTLLSHQPLAVGLNEVFYDITRDGAPVTEAAVVQKPVMNMATMKHACPLVNPEGAANHHGQFEGKLVFTMPSSELETWDLTLEVTPEGDAAPTLVKLEALAVADSAARKSVDLFGQAHVVTLTFDGAPRVGSNPYFVTVHRPENMMKMTFLPVTDLTLVATPQMPSMGHGSSGNVNPTHVGGGVYEGTVNFSMAGDWVVHLELVGAGDTVLGTLEWPFEL